MSRALSAKEAEAVILLRMAASRGALLAANSAPRSGPGARGQARSPTAIPVASLADAPRVALLLALCVGVIILGPRRTIGIAGRSGITAWVGGAVRKAVLKSV
jgi:hypothetical protein